MIDANEIEPIGFRVLVLPDVIEEKIGNIFIPEASKEQKKYAQIKATVVAVGLNAWEEDKARAPSFVPPQKGDRILIQKYGGIDFECNDKQMYRLLNDQDILAKIGA